MWNWFKRKRISKSPTISQERIGEVQVRCGTIFIADPIFISDPVRIEAVPPGLVPVSAIFIHYPEGGLRIARIGLRFRPGDAESQQTLGQVGVDSATVVVLDAQTYRECWKEVGPERIGQTATPKHHRRVAQLIEKQFGLRSREVNDLHSEFLEPISEELEARITAYLKTFPEYAEYPFFFFRIETGNTFERIQQAMGEKQWATVVLDAGSSASLLAVSSGFGDGTYPVEGLYRSGELVGVEVEFIDPEMDETLRAFPILRY